MQRPFLLALLAVVSATLPETARPQTTWVRLAPYRDIVWPADTTRPPRILLDQQWFELVSVDSVPVATLIASARTAYGRLVWQKRFDEDLHEVLIGAGRPPRFTVVLGLRDTASGRISERTATFNAENRAALMAAKGARQPAAPPPAGRTGGTGARAPAPAPTQMSAADVARDIDALEQTLESQWAYLKANGVDHKAALASLRARARGGITRDAYGLEVLKLISLFIDGHASVGGFSYPTGGALPFVLDPAGDRFVAVGPGRRRLIDSLYPFVTHLDGRPIADWIRAATPYVSKASPQWRTNRALRLVQRVDFVRSMMGIPASDSIVLQLASRDGRSDRRVVMRVSDAGASAPELPTTRSQLLDGNIGYLRLASMDNAAVQEVASWMPRFRDTRGLIIDVRGNGGGSRDALRALFPYLMSEADAPRVINAAKYRLAPSFAEDHLGGSRYMYRESWSGWTAAERAAIAGFRATFTPQWEPPAAEFSDWHYIVMSRRTNPDAYVYSRPAIVLHDAGSFSATDIFVAAFKGWRNVTLVGAPTGGGSARQVPVSLPVSRLSLSLASMASFRWDGKLFDGNGTAPDVLVHPDPEYFLVGGRDNVLERAISLLTSRTP